MTEKQGRLTVIMTPLPFPGKDFCPAAFPPPFPSLWIKYVIYIAFTARPGRSGGWEMLSPALHNLPSAALDSQPNGLLETNFMVLNYEMS